MNYIKHLNAVFELFAKDGRLNPTHISQYLALFQLWNRCHFTTVFHIDRQEVMALSKIGSKSTYHRTVKELSHWGYLLYLPSHNPFKGSQIKMFDFGTTPEQAVYTDRPISGTTDEQAVVPKYKPFQTLENKTNKTKISKNSTKQILKETYQQGPTVPYRDNLKTSHEKDYGEPL